MCTRSALRWASVHLLLTTAALPLVIIRRVIYFFLLLLYTLVCNPCEKYRAGTHESAECPRCFIALLPLDRHAYRQGFRVSTRFIGRRESSADELVGAKGEKRFGMD